MVIAPLDDCSRKKVKKSLNFRQKGYKVIKKFFVSTGFKNKGYQWANDFTVL